MRLPLNKLILAISLVTLTACSHNPNQNESNTAEDNQSVFPLATPVQISYQDEVKLLRINQMIADKEKVDDKQRAVLYYQRGLIYDRIGLSAHSRYDFTQSINIDPTLADSYKALGVYQLMGGAYDEAFESFDSAIELANVEYAYLHRAIGLSFVNRDKGAEEDINSFYQFDKADPYRSLWRYIINYRIDPKLALTQLKSATKYKVKDGIAWDIIDVINGDISEQELFANISDGIQNNYELAQRLCEVYYYLAHWHINNNNLHKGIYYLKLALSTNVKDYIEYKYALVDLSIIQQQLLQENIKTVPMPAQSE